MNNLDKQYTDLLQDILDNGVQKGDRTGTGTISVFGRQIRHKMSDGFPLLTTKKMPFKTIVTELLWFLRGDTNIKYLVDNNCHIWDGDAYKNYENKYYKGEAFGYKKLNDSGYSPDLKLSQEEFINKIKTDDEFAKKWGSLGKIYGHQWRNWAQYNLSNHDTYVRREGMMNYRKHKYDVEIKHIDQISNLINDLKTNPDSRRLMVNAWNVGEIDQMVLPPCHYGFQVYTRELSSQERMDVYNKSNWNKDIFPSDVSGWNRLLDTYNIPTRAISLMWNQRSVDTFLGLPFNIASYGLLLEILAKEVNMVPDELIGNLGDTHLYLNHIEQAKEQIGRDLTDEERYNKWFKNNVVSGMERFFDAKNLPDFDDPYYVVTPKRTREPFKLPTIEITERNWYQHQLVKEHLGPKPFSEKILSYRPDCFELIGYESHPKINAPLSN
jgi:thymidylate synthase